MRPVALNVFQRTQRLWDRLHPYNAAQLMAVAIEPDASRIGDAFARALRDLRLGAFVATGNYFVVDSSDRAFELLRDDDLPALLTRELNRPFSAGRSMPFRPLLSRDADGAIVGLIYQHWVADSVSIRLLMRQWLLHLAQTPCPETAIAGNPARFEHGTLLRRFGPGAGGWSAVGQLVEVLGFARSMKRMRRVERLPRTLDVAVTLRDAPAGLIARLVPAVRRADSTVGDAFLAAAALACAAHGPTTMTRRRPDLALGTIVDLRSRRPAMPADTFGLYLGFMISTFRRRELTSFTDALRAARRLRLLQTGRRSAEASQLRMAVGLLMAKLMPPDALRTFYRKRFPLGGGLSNVNLSRDRLASTAPGVLRHYWRVSPTGPLLPLVLTPTTLGDDLTLCCTYQPAVIEPAMIEALIADFFTTLATFSD